MNKSDIYAYNAVRSHAACPKCGAVKGARCMTPTGDGRDKPHGERWKLYRKPGGAKPVEAKRVESSGSNPDLPHMKRIAEWRARNGSAE